MKEKVQETQEKIKARIFTIAGLAGSGKTSFIAKSREELKTNGKRVYVINLDPAVENMYYPVNLDIRDTIDYAEVCKANNTGPNGAILLSLNLFVSKIDELMRILQKKINVYDYILLDTPGQIEFLLWSASGNILSENLKKLDMNATLLYMMDITKCTFATGGYFSSNILLLSQIVERTNLRCDIVMNKSDVEVTQSLKSHSMKRVKEDDMKTELSNEIMETFGSVFNKKRHYVSSMTGDNVLKVYQ